MSGSDFLGFKLHRTNENQWLTASEMGKGLQARSESKWLLSSTHIQGLVARSKGDMYKISPPPLWFGRSLICYL